MDRKFLLEEECMLFGLIFIWGSLFFSVAEAFGMAQYISVAIRIFITSESSPAVRLLDQYAWVCFVRTSFPMSLRLAAPYHLIREHAMLFLMNENTFWSFCVDFMSYPYVRDAENRAQVERYRFTFHFGILLNV